MLVTSKIHIRKYNKAEKLLYSLTKGTNIRYKTIKYNHRKGTGFIVLIGEKRFVDYIIKYLDKENYLTKDQSYFSTKVYYSS